MDSMNVSTKTFKMSEACNENLQSVDFNATNWNCLTSKAFLGCYFEHIKEEEENRDGTIRSKSVEEKKLKCSTEEYQQLIPIITGNISHEQLCKCFDCLQIYQKQNVDFLFGIKNIECLPTEILLMIFKDLRPSDRRVASECCKRFLAIWLCDAFIDDRRLVFDKCVLDPSREPLSVFMKSSRNYRHLVVGDIVMREESIFAAIFSETATTVELIHTFSVTLEHNSKNFLLLSQFVNLKTIKVASIELLGDFSNVPTTIELLVISDYLWLQDDKLDKLKCYIDKTSDSFRVELDGIISPEAILSFTESQRNKIQSVDLHLRENDKLFKLPRCVNLKNLKLDFHDWCDYGTEDILENHEEQLPALKDLSIEIHERLPHKNWTCFKTLDAWFIPMDELSRLSIFGNLSELRLESSDDECVFVHGSILNKNLKTLNIGSLTKNPCFTCFQTITKSFPNLTSLTCDFDVANDQLTELTTNTPKLRSLYLEHIRSSSSLECLRNLTDLRFFLSNSSDLMIETLPLMFQLRNLIFRLSHLNSETVKIFERMPALEVIWICCEFIDGDQLALFEMVIKPLKRLRNFEFVCEGIQSEIYPKIIDVLASNCKYLQQIKFPFYKPETAYLRENIMKQLSEKHSSIRCINGAWLK